VTPRKILTLDIGGTSVKSATAEIYGDADDVALGLVKVFPHRALDVASLSSSMLSIVESALAEEDIGAIGICTTGLVSTNGRVVHGPVFDGYQDFSWAATLEPLFSGTVKVMNDAHAAALGMCVGEGVDPDELVLCLVVGTGLGGALVHRGRVLPGRRGMSGHFGHMKSPSSAAHYECICGVDGCFENLASGRGLARLVEGTSDLNNVDDVVQRLSSDLFGKDVQAAVSAASLFEAVGYELGSVVADLINALDPHRILLSGGLLRAAEADDGNVIVRAMWEAVIHKAIPAILPGLEIGLSSVRSPNLMGAASAALDSIRAGVPS